MPEYPGKTQCHWGSGWIDPSIILDYYTTSTERQSIDSGTERKRKASTVRQREREGKRDRGRDFGKKEKKREGGRIRASGLNHTWH